MEKRYKIGLFFICTVILIVIILLLWKRSNGNTEIRDIEKTPQIQSIEKENKSNQSVESADEKQTEENNIDASQAQNVESVTNQKTICIYENIDKNNGISSIDEELIAQRFVGLTRSEMEKALREEEKMIVLESKDGFKSQHLELFSPEKIKILRIYDTSEVKKGYYIMEVEGEVRVYEEDRETLYFRSELILDDLPDNVKQEVIDGKYMDSETQVYNFLESYSS